MASIGKSASFSVKCWIKFNSVVSDCAKNADCLSENKKKWFPKQNYFPRVRPRPSVWRVAVCINCVVREMKSEMKSFFSIVLSRQFMNETDGAFNFSGILDVLGSSVSRSQSLLHPHAELSFYWFNLQKSVLNATFNNNYKFKIKWNVIIIVFFFVFRGNMGQKVTWGSQVFKAPQDSK